MLEICVSKIIRFILIDKVSKYIPKERTLRCFSFFDTLIFIMSSPSFILGRFIIIIADCSFNFHYCGCVIKIFSIDLIE